MFEIIWTEFAISELKSIYLYYLMVASKRTANKIKKSIFSAVQNLPNQPFMGQIEENLVSLSQEHRYLVEGKYKIIYFIKENVIYITDVFDCRQDPQKMNR